MLTAPAATTSAPSLTNAASVWPAVVIAASTPTGFNAGVWAAITPGR
jgi:hypothetical protein